MLYVCPHCGDFLPVELKDGLAHCPHCNRITDSGLFNRLLAGAWLCRRHHQSLEQLQTCLPPDEAFLVFSFVCEQEYSHEEFRQFLKKMGVPEKAYMDYSGTP